MDNVVVYIDFVLSCQAGSGNAESFSWCLIHDEFVVTGQKYDAADQQYLDFNESIKGLIWTRRFDENDPVRAWGSDSGTWNEGGSRI